MPGPPGPPGPPGNPGNPGESGFGSLFQDFTATPNQTAFVLGSAPAAPNKVVLVVDTMFFYLGKGIVSIVGTTVNWDNTNFFNMAAGQDVRIYY